MSNDDQLDEQLRRTARRSMERRAAAVDSEAALSELLSRRNPSRTSGRGDRRWLVAAAALVVVVAGIAAIAWPRGAKSPSLVATETAATSPPTPGVTQVTTTMGSPTTTTTPEPTSSPAWIPTPPTEVPPPATANLPYLVYRDPNQPASEYRYDFETSVDGPAPFVQTFSNDQATEGLYIFTEASSPFAGAQYLEPRAPFGPWTVSAVDNIGGTRFVLLKHPNVTVVLSTSSESTILDVDALIAVSQALIPRDGGLNGWQTSALPGGLMPVAEGFWWGWGGRSQVLLLADGTTIEVAIDVGVPGDAFPLVTRQSATAEIIDFDGRRASLDMQSGITSLQWMRDDGVVVALWYPRPASAEEMADLARTHIVELTADEWGQIPKWPESDCPSYQC